MLANERDRNISDVARAFSFGQLQDCATLIRILRRHGIQGDEFLEYVETEKERRVRARHEMKQRRAEIDRLSPKCPTCGIPMVLREVHPPDPGTGDPGDPAEGCHWTCPKCRFGRYDRRTIREARTALGA